ncbi:MAG: phosphatidylserine decarboxylase [Bacteroidaceae bacterium]|nr:phosphatidylserine decarboxylase [Bacteroidaceae bacterium]
MSVRYIYKKVGLALIALTLTIASCRDDDDTLIDTPEQQDDRHTDATRALIQICETNAEVKALLSHAIAQAAEINPDRDYNPAQTLTEFYDFVDWNVRQLPWDVMIHPAPNDYGRSLYGRADQGIGYFWFVVDQPLDELRDRGFFYPTVEFVEPFASWLSTYSNSWGEWLNTEASWNDTYYNMVKNDPDWGLLEGWYGEGNQWRTFNEFFARSLASPDMRPIGSTEVVAPADSWPKQTWEIDDNNQLVYTDEEQLQIKTARISDIAQLIGSDSRYKDAFAGGTLTHTFLDVNCYHRYHAPVAGTLRELRRVPGVSAGGGYTMWDNEQKLYYYQNDIGFQMVETRACAIIETDEYGLVAMMPVGMSQICSVNWVPELCVGQRLQRGDEMGFFQFGGSDIVMLFQRGVEVEIVHDGELTLMGEPYAILHQR